MINPAETESLASPWIRSGGPPSGPETESLAFVRGLVAHGDNVALITPDASMTYRDLAARVEAQARRLAGERRLVLLVGANTIDAIVAYLAVLAAGHPAKSVRIPLSLVALGQVSRLVWRDLDPGGRVRCGSCR